jgi:hypothetical protein
MPSGTTFAEDARRKEQNVERCRRPPLAELIAGRIQTEYLFDVLLKP